MATDALTRVENRAGAHLEPGEHYVAAQPMTVKGPVALSNLLEGIDADAALGNYVTAHGSVDELEVVDAQVPNAFLVAVTNRRVMVFGRAMSGRPKDLVADQPLAEVTLDVIDHGDRVRARTFVFGRGDGTIFAGEAGINGSAAETADRFVAAFAGS